MTNIKNMNVGSIRKGIQCVRHKAQLSSIKVKNPARLADFLVLGMLSNPQILQQWEKL